MKQLSPWYRADIDGLRAIAILGVIAIHFSLGLTTGFLKGGQLGVDVFFVISGYLITSIVMREFKNDSFSLVKFWERRIRRIVPALVVVMFCATAYLYVHDKKFSEYPTFGQSVSSQSFFVFNHYLLETNERLFTVEGTSPKIPQSATSKEPNHAPLNHLWSLSVEEQFYILFPLILFGVWKINRKLLLPTLLTVAAGSFFLFLYLWSIDPYSKFPFSYNDVPNIRAGFYTLPARAWELLAGALAALATIKINKSFAEVLSATGVVMILFSFLFPLNPLTLYRIAPICVIGTVLILLANKDANTYTKKILSIKPLVWLGLISYSLYLWHWPLYVFTKGFYPNLPHNYFALFCLFIVCVIVSSLSYRYVERPFLEKGVWTTKEIYLHGFLALLFVGLLGFAIMTTYAP